MNAGSGTQTISYCYDPLNRMTAKVYTAMPSCLSSAGAAATYAYDTSSVSGASNVVGRLTDEKSLVRGTLVSERSPYGYDGLGQIQSEQQCPFSAACAAPYTFSYSYDLAGNMTGSTNGLSTAAASLTFGYSYDGEGHMNSASTTSQPWNSTAYPSILMQANQTSPAGQPGTARDRRGTVSRERMAPFGS